MTVTDTKPASEPKATPASGNHKRPPKAFERTYSRWGLLGALFFFSLSLVPSLLPRSGLLQGLVSGITAVIGYGLVCAFVAIWHYVQGPVPHGTARRWTLLIGLGALALLLVYSVWKFVGWQNESRNLMGMDPLSPLVWPTILIFGVLSAWLLLAAGGAFRTLFPVERGPRRSLVASPPRGHTVVDHDAAHHLGAALRRDPRRVLRRRERHLLHSRQRRQAVRDAANR